MFRNLRKTNKYHLITSLYNESVSTRMEELMFCLEKNLRNPIISKIHIFYDTSRDQGSISLINKLRTWKKNELILIEGRPTFNMIFEYANKRLSNRRIIICNADIYFNKSLTLLNKFDLSGKFVTLSRWNLIDQDDLKLIMLPEINLPNYFSADVWIYKSPIKIDFYCDYALGTMFCDSFLNTQLFKADFSLYNPCLDVQACHLQKGMSISQQYDSPEMKAKKDDIFNKEFIRNKNRIPISGVVWSDINAMNELRNNQYLWTQNNIIIEISELLPENYKIVLSLFKELYKQKRINLWFYDKFCSKKNIEYIYNLNCAHINIVESYSFGNRTIYFQNDFDLKLFFSLKKDLYVGLNQIEAFSDCLVNSSY